MGDNKNNQRIFRLICVTFLASASAISLAAKDHTPGRLVVQTRKDADAGLVTRAVTSHGARVRARHLNTDVWVLDVPDPQLNAIAASLEKTGLFTFVEPDYIARKAAVPNDPNFGSQWYLS